LRTQAIWAVYRGAHMCRYGRVGVGVVS
jgi:hypothetical protein